MVHAADLLSKRAELTPNRTALVDLETGIRYTYAELNQRANQLASHLRKVGVTPDATIAVCTERSWEMVVGILGTLKAGGAYMPLDPQYPKERLAYMLDDSGASALLTQETLVEQLRE